MKLPLRTRRELALLNAQDWQDFKAHWPMRVVEFVLDMGYGILLGATLGLSLTIYALEFAA